MPNNRADIYALARELQVNSDDLLRLIEAAELLGFATIAYGDITSNPLGETFAEASIRGRKEIFATRIRRLPLFKWLLALLRATDKKQLEWDEVQKALELEFHAEEAERQLDTAIDWGRYAELLAYDDSSQVLFLEPGGRHAGFAREKEPARAGLKPGQLPGACLLRLSSHGAPREPERETYSARPTDAGFSPKI